MVYLKNNLEGMKTLLDGSESGVVLLVCIGDKDVKF